MAELRKSCAFCGDYAKLTDEHVWPDWLSPYVPKLYRQTAHAASLRTESRGGAEFHKKHTLQNGDPHSVRLKIVCEKCNGGWMSRLQSQAKPILVPLMEGHWSNLSTWDRRILSAWATMYTMVVEFKDPFTQATTFDERDHLRLTFDPPKNWHVWIAPFEGNKWHGVFNHFGWQHPILVLPTKLGSDIVAGRALPPKANIQSTAFVIRKLFLMTFSHINPILSFNARTFAEQDSLSLIWPRNEAAIVRPQHTLTDFTADFVSSALQISPRDKIRRAWEV